MRSFIFLVVLCLFYSCKKQSVEDSITSNQNIVNSDSLEREQISEAMGDTAFGGVCYGMDLKQTTKAINDFKISLGYDSNSSFFKFGNYSFSISNPSEIENLSIHDLDVNYINALLYHNQLFKIRWISKKNYAKTGEDVATNLLNLISIFEAKYGKCSFKDLNSCYYIGRKVINGKLFPVRDTIAKWDTNNKCIKIAINELFGSDRGQESSDFPLQYNLTISFFNKTMQKEVDAYVDSIRTDKKNKDSERINNTRIKEINAL